jgi:shikimate dehydrogenase
MKPDDPNAVDANRLDAGSTVVDIVNSPDPTALCRAARARGCRTQSGRPMHEGQAVHALRFLGFDYLPEGKSVSDHWLAALTAKDGATQCHLCPCTEGEYR